MRSVASVDTLELARREKRRADQGILTLQMKVWFGVLYIYAFQGIIGYFVGAVGRLLPYVQLMNEGMIILFGFSLIGKDVNRVPKRLLMLFMTTSTATYLLHVGDLSIVMHLNGLRDYLLLFCAYAYANALIQSDLREEFLARFAAFIKMFLVLQIPAAFYQFSKYGAGDDVGGTFGPWGSGLLTISIFLLAFYLVRFHWNKDGSERFSVKNNLKVLPLFIPVLINETKVTFVMLGLFYMLQFNESSHSCRWVWYAAFRGDRGETQAHGGNR
jgi:hypothetical protein